MSAFVSFPIDAILLSTLIGVVSGSSPRRRTTYHGSHPSCIGCLGILRPHSQHYRFQAIPALKRRITTSLNTRHTTLFLGHTIYSVNHMIHPNRKRLKTAYNKPFGILGSAIVRGSSVRRCERLSSPMGRLRNARCLAWLMPMKEWILEVLRNSWRR
jgi:hypothetical protein